MAETLRKPDDGSPENCGDGLCCIPHANVRPTKKVEVQRAALGKQLRFMRGRSLCTRPRGSQNLSRNRLPRGRQDRSRNWGVKSRNETCWREPRGDRRMGCVGVERPIRTRLNYACLDFRYGQDTLNAILNVPCAWFPGRRNLDHHGMATSILSSGTTPRCHMGRSTPELQTARSCLASRPLCHRILLQDKDLNVQSIPKEDSHSVIPKNLNPDYSLRISPQRTQRK